MKKIILGFFTYLFVSQANATLISTGAVYPNLTSSSGTTSQQITVGFNGSQGYMLVDYLTFGNGITTLSSSYPGSIGLVVGHTNGGAGKVDVLGNGTAGSASIDLPNSIVVGSGGGSPRGDLNVVNGGTVHTDHLQVGTGAGGNGGVTVSGAGSLIEVTDPGFGSVQIGNAGGSGAVLVENNGRIRAPVSTIFPEYGIMIGDPNDPAFNARVTLNSGGTLEGNIAVTDGGKLLGNGGVIVGDLLVDGGTVAPGLSPGELTVLGDANLADGLLQLEWEGIANHDLLTVAGALTFGPDLIIELIFGSLPLATIDLTDFFLGSQGGTVINVDDFDFQSQLMVSFASTADSGIASVSLFGQDTRTFENVSVPEPSTVVLLTLGLLGLNGVRRKFRFQ